jgi:hypothetical protein
MGYLREPGVVRKLRINADNADGVQNEHRFWRGQHSRVASLQVRHRRLRLCMERGDAKMARSVTGLLSYGGGAAGTSSRPEQSGLSGVTPGHCENLRIRRVSFSALHAGLLTQSETR